MSGTTAWPVQVPFYSSAQIMSAVDSFDLVEAVSSAYLNLYDPESPPIKYVLPHEGVDGFTVIMPYENVRDGLYFEKVVFVNRERRPGVTGYASVFDTATHSPVALMDATALTGYRTAAKSLLFASVFFRDHVRSSPRIVNIYGSSTQAFFHALMFANRYSGAIINVIARSEGSRDRFVRMLADHAPHLSSVNVFSVVPSDYVPDVIVTATSSNDPLITRESARGVPLIIAVGSSSGRQSEVDGDVVADSNRYVDSRVSIDGKGEYRISVDSGRIARGSIRELSNVLVDGASHLYGEKPTTLFVSKGLIIEDYVFALRIIRHK